MPCPTPDTLCPAHSSCDPCQTNVPPAEPTTQDPPDAPGPDEPDSSPADDAVTPHAIRVQAVYHTDISQANLEGWLDEQLRHAAELSGVTQAQLTIAVVADDEMARLHEQYTGVQGTTDVLTFDLADQAESDSSAGPTTGAHPIEGDIVVCLDEARRQAQQRGHETRVELLLYAVHGLMHLLGEDDHDEDDYQRMHAREDALLKCMGFGPLFDPDRYDD